MGSLNSVGWLGMRLRFVSDSAPQSVCLGAGKQKLDVGAGKFGAPGSGAITVNIPGIRPGRITKRNHGRGKAVSATKHLPVIVTYGPQRVVNAGDVN
jgi:hypothetical protein